GHANPVPAVSGDQVPRGRGRPAGGEGEAAILDEHVDARGAGALHDGSGDVGADEVALDEGRAARLEVDGLGVAAVDDEPPVRGRAASEHDEAMGRARAVELDRRYRVQRAGHVRVRLRARLREAVDRDGIHEERDVVPALRSPYDMNRVHSSTRDIER